MPRIFSSLIQSDFRGGSHGNFEAVVQEGNSLVHWFRDNADGGMPWKRAQVIVPSGVAAAGCLIQSDLKGGNHGNFEAAVPVFAADNTMELWHYFHDNSDVSRPWQRGQLIARNVAGPACMIQSDFKSGGHGNFELVVPVVSEGRIDLKHFWRQNADISAPWQSGQIVAANVVGPGCLIQSDFQGGGHGNFEVAVPLPAPDGTHELWHFFRTNSNLSTPWQRGQRIAQFVNGPGVLLQSDFKNGDHGNFEVLVPIGNSLVHFFHDNSDVSRPWQRGQTVCDAANGWASLMRSNYGPAGHRNFEVLVEECSQSLVSYWHPNQDVNLPWMRDKVLIGEPYPARSAGGTRKICQLTGQFDREGWNGQGTPPLAFNQTESQIGLRGCDLGSSFEHKGRVYFLFGDSWRVGQGGNNLDSVAWSTDTAVNGGVHLTFLPQPPHVPNMDQSAFNVPVEGFSYNGAMYVFFTTGHYQVDGRDLMGCSVLTRSSDDGQNYTQLGVFSNRKFVNVSVQQGTLDPLAGRMLNLAAGTPVLWIWGTGRYRASGIHLAVLPLAGLERLSGIRYLAGKNVWSSHEDDAVSLICTGDAGELSVRWNQFLGRWLLLFNSSNPRGILMHSAPQPWGPWSSSPVMIFDPGVRTDPNNPCSGAGYGRFMHIPWSERVCDHVQDDMFTPGAFRDNEWGGEYGPYQITRFTQGINGQSSQIWFTMSVWNPYQSVLMTTELNANLL